MKTLLSMLLMLVLAAGAIGCGQSSAGGCGCGQNTIRGREMSNTSNVDQNPDQDISAYGSDVR